ncbi:UDP-glucuronosyltransferase [Clostridium botulinum]|uniref:MGDG synthase family glycosyltransferase n=1 Tax=Clostridium botulinum TaxID=1491 RepID=UPI00099B5309|nr:glycosyltransferase [Clostridium botulinum]NFA98318.1 UDP-N-acetylglucosamine--LPS N-acetylglucosamine transferase [Clostridium botulinum]NFB51832.1 UDP-N-acetylglucosamine--LPS N-acetylglucosamine transferase [Clostridium botulinum]NFC76244.1 UDP-N-acetylglucosamine--LPS N-acetylglucosamine transferase [Clostridium botulinum]NFC89233.1 UDP-N-acetylglucosamine--LPS N-acetylglucosamine transferase [Clostridium botulinum]NFD05702.1 UDP-N-acetylglucosamine--LPS N-acetylglucosamine transferase 
MKILILSVSAGGGHIHAAEALKSYIKLNNNKAEITVIDTLKYINPLIDKVIIGSYLKTLKVTPSLFGKLYDHSEDDEGLATVISSNLSKIMTYKLSHLINEFNPDVIICTHPFPAEMISIMKDKGKLNIPSLTILTDYSPHSFWIQEHTDAYVVSNSDMIDEMVARNVPKNKIFDFGIPISPSFLKKYDKEKTLKELDLNINIPTFLIMGGSLGIGKISDLYSELIKIDQNMQIIIITGNNKKLYSQLNKLKENSNKETRIIGFTDKVNKYMQCCDLLLTKPGGLTITEALVSNIPMAVFSPIPGQEEKNAEFLLRHNLAISIDSIEDTKDIISDLLKSESALKTMSLNCNKFAKPNSGNDIYNLLKFLMSIKKNDSSKNKMYVSTPVISHKNKNLFKSIEKYFIKTAEKFLL